MCKCEHRTTLTLQSMYRQQNKDNKVKLRRFKTQKKTEINLF